MNVRTRFLSLALLGTTLLSAPAHAQILPAPPDTAGARVRLGPFWLNPTLSVNNVGIDTNLFNEAEVVDPRRDVAVTFAPQTELWMRIGRTWLTGNVREDLIWFRDYRDQRSANGTYRGGLYVPLTRVTFLVDGGYVRSRERPSVEIDLRADRRERLATAAAEARTWSRTFVGARVEYRAVEFSSNALFGGQDLSQQLNRTRMSGTLAIRHELTPMTSVTVEAATSQDRFTYAPDRDAAASQLVAGLLFDPNALVKGHVLVGYQRFAWGGVDIPPYTGPTLAASLSYIVRTSTRVTVDSGRDVQYSFDPIRPYYLQTSFATTITQRLFGPFDAQGRLGVRALDYRDRLTAGSGLMDRRDRVRTLATSLGYRLGRSTRLAFDYETQRRSSPIVLRNYRGSRYGLSAIWTP